MREIVFEYIKNPNKELEAKLTTMELEYAKKQIASKANEKPKGKQ